MAQLLTCHPVNKHLELILSVEVMDLDAGMVLLLDQNTESDPHRSLCGLPEAVSLSRPLRPSIETALYGDTAWSLPPEALLTCCEGGMGTPCYEPLQAIGFQRFDGCSALLAGKTSSGPCSLEAIAPKSAYG